MGRIETVGESLVDIEEAIKLLGKSRPTIFRLVAKGELMKIALAGNSKLYLTLASVTRLQEMYKSKKRLRIKKEYTSKKVEDTDPYGYFD
jgi:hypothetical protein